MFKLEYEFLSTDFTAVMKDFDFSLLRFNYINAPQDWKQPPVILEIISEALEKAEQLKTVSNSLS